MPGRLEFDIGFRPQGAPKRRRRETGPLRILVVASLSGGAPDAENIADRAVSALDIDNFDRIMRRRAVGLGSDQGTRIDFADLDDFHPDRLYERLGVFAALRDLRARLLDAATFDAAAAELLGDDAGDDGARDPATPAKPAPDMFERLLGASAGTAPDTAARGRSAIGGLIADVVAPYIEPDIADRQQQLVAMIDQSVGELMSLLLHARPFQRLEARWRSLHSLVSSFEAEEEAQVFVFDATPAELAADLAAQPLEQTSLYRRLIDREKDTAGGTPWSMVVIDHTFGADAGELDLLARLGGLASHAGGPLLAAADLSLCGCPSVAATPDAHDWQTNDDELVAAWSALRAHPVAAHIGLAAPRVLARLPYGRRLEETSAFEYDEFAHGRAHESYLWANPAFAVAQALTGDLLGQSALTLDDLPMHVYDDQGERQLQPCAEAWLNDRSAQAILDCGIMALVSHKNRNAVQILRLQSIAKPASALV